MNIHEENQGISFMGDTARVRLIGGKDSGKTVVIPSGIEVFEHAPLPTLKRFEESDGFNAEKHDTYYVRRKTSEAYHESLIS